MPIKMTKRSISSLMTTTDGCVGAKARAEFTIKQSAYSSAFLHATFNEENLFTRMEMSRSLFFGLAFFLGNSSYHRFIKHCFSGLFCTFSASYCFIFRIPIENDKSS
ncbi:hypothetical protein AVEN_77919-1 [Araneus ventricosus]|uniref:Uncharacterized protein n=1 Tax=Araneus ventricosus TaxID=182803 RepID=A0A4Y2DW08_ARAVE|nr:hypothetical protein AVEN_77919-1 [Araneus ventricosus]